MLGLLVALAAWPLCRGVGPDAVPTALASNDECEDGTCALNALQHHRVFSDPYDPNAPQEEYLPPDSPKWLNCDPLCPEMPVPGDEASGETLGAGPVAGPEAEEEGLGSMGLWHMGANCWYRCHGAGECSNFCGPGNACCRYRAHHDPGVCRQARWWPVIHWHTCVMLRHPAPSQSFEPDSEGSADCSGRGANGEVITVYHQTGCDVGPKILREGFRLGRSGWCGGGIYFARSPEATKTKAVGPDSHKGFMIEARVRIGHTAQGDKKCKVGGQTLQGRALLEKGYDSIEFDPGDGQEVIVYCSNQVVSTRAYPWKCS